MNDSILSGNTTGYPKLINWLGRLKFPFYETIKAQKLTGWLIMSFWLLIPLESYIGYSLLHMFRQDDFIPPFSLVFAKAILIVTLPFAANRAFIAFANTDPKAAELGAGGIGAWILCTFILWLTTDIVWVTSLFLFDFFGKTSSSSEDLFQFFVAHFQLQGGLMNLGDYPNSWTALLAGNFFFAAIATILLALLSSFYGRRSVCISADVSKYDIWFGSWFFLPLILAIVNATLSWIFNS